MSYRTHVTTMLHDGYEELMCSHTKQAVARIECDDLDTSDPWIVRFMGELEGTPQRSYHNLKAAQYGAFAEYINLNR